MKIDELTQPEYERIVAELFSGNYDSLTCKEFRAMMNMICEFAGCDKPLDTRWQPQEGKKFCAARADEFAALAKAEDIPGIMSFFARSNGLIVADNIEEADGKQGEGWFLC